MPTLDEQILSWNPWWNNPGAVANDPHIRTFEGAPVRWDPPLLRTLPLRLGDAHTLRGPRQVGKTTLTKRIIRRLVEAGETRVLYFNLDLQRDSAAVYDVIRRAKALHPDPDGPWYLFLDEVTSVTQWQKGVKLSWDQGLTREDFLLLIGSSAHDLKVGAEQLPGRRGNGSDFLHLPLSFRDFCCQVEGIDLPEETTNPEGYLGSRGRTLARRLYLSFGSLERAFRLYLQVGGYPAAVCDYRTSGTLQATPQTIRMLWGAIAGDMAKSGRDQTAAVKLLGEVAPSLMQGARRPSQDGMIENLVATGLFRSAAQVLAQAYAVPGAVGYWRSTNNRELDFVVPAEEFGRGGRLPIEVKSDDESRIGHARLAIRKAFGNGIVVSRSVFEPSGEVPVIPVPVFLAGLREVGERVVVIA